MLSGFEVYPRWVPLILQIFFNSTSALNSCIEKTVTTIVLDIDERLLRLVYILVT